MHREYFPILEKQINGKPLVYLDNAATTQKPFPVIDAINEMHTSMNANIHRGVHFMAEKCTELYEESREAIRDFINAEKKHEIIFTAGTTAAINLVAFSFGEKFVHTNDEIIISEMEHHSNIVPWQMLCERKGAKLKVLPINNNGELILEELPKLISDKTKLIAITQVANVLGTINPIAEIVKTAHASNIPVLVDGAQGAQHGGIDVQQTDCDFYVFSGHKLYGPTGIGVLYAKEKWLEEMPPYQGGGDMVKTVSFEKTVYADLPFKFEAGTANYIGAVGLCVAVRFIKSLGIESLQKHENELLRYATDQLQNIGGVTIYGNASKKISTLSFLIDGVHHLDTAQILDKLGIAVRTGTLCAEPTMKHYDVNGMVRASFAFYNTMAEVDALVDGIKRVKTMFG